MSNPPQPLSLQELTLAVTRQLMSGKSQAIVVQELVARGWPEVSARQFVLNKVQSLDKLKTEAGTGTTEESDERRYVAELFRRRALRDFLLTAAFLLAMLAVVDLLPSLPSLALFFLSMCTFSFVDLLVALVGWWRNRS